MQLPDKADFPIIKEILEEGDRGAAVIAGGFLEAKLTELITLCLREDKDTARQLLKPTGPLGGFGNKVLLGYMLKLYRKETRNDLTLIGEIRNRFAHVPDPMTFESEYVRERCEKITLYHRVWSTIPDFKLPSRPYNQADARWVFLEAVSLAVNFLHNQIQHPENRQKSRDNDFPF